MNSRDRILQRLKAAPKPFSQAQPPANRLSVTPLATASEEAVLARFIQEAQALSCEVHSVANNRQATERILEILAGQKRILAWDFDHIPCAELHSALQEADIAVAAADDPTALFGITGADAALAATGSLVIMSGSGRHRTTALLPQTHIAVITQDQIMPNLEGWLDEQRTHDLQDFTQAGNINIISGPSRTADIAMELILGMHGPAAMHIIIISA